MARLAALCLILFAGCAAGSSSAREAPSGAPAIRWQSRIDSDHPLVGRIWDSAGQRFMGELELRERIAAARLLVLGEQHDNPDHHRLQARALEALVTNGRKPALVFEMLDLADQPAIDRARSEAPDDPDAIARAVAWDESGWPPFALYRPLFVVAARERLPLFAAGLPREQAMRIAREGAAALDPALVQRFALGAPLDPATQAALRAEMNESHCGLMPAEMLDAMALIQRARDAQFADRLHAAGQADADGAVLIAGNGHARTDRGVPAALQRGYGERALALAMVEVQGDWTEPLDYTAAWSSEQLPFDFLWFTPRANDTDHCAELRKQHAPPK